jgi:hypothetical protein
LDVFLFDREGPKERRFRAIEEQEDRVELVEVAQNSDRADR